MCGEINCPSLRHGLHSRREPLEVVLLRCNLVTIKLIKCFDCQVIETDGQALFQYNLFYHSKFDLVCFFFSDSAEDITNQPFVK